MRLIPTAVAFALMLATCLPARAADRPEAAPLYWYDGQRRVPLQAVVPPASLARRLPPSVGEFRGSPGGRLFENDGRLYVCYPETWEEAQIAALEARYGLQRESSVSRVPDIRLYRETAANAAVLTANRIFEENRLPCAAPLWKKSRVGKGGRLPDDPLFSQQWYLYNTGQCSGIPGEDIAATAAWQRSLGAGVAVAIVDDGLETTHPDLLQNLLPSGHFDFIDDDADPTAGAHGTAVAGLVAGRGFNGIGLAGTAPAAALLGLRILPEDGELSDEADEAAALGYDVVPVELYNNSWGPADGSLDAFDGPSPLVRAAMERRIREGRGGLGSLYVWAAGNGGEADDANLDGYANSRYAIAVTATTCTGMAASYAESGSNILVSAPSGDGDIGMVTTDRTRGDGYNTGAEWGELSNLDYTNSFSGTSAAVPVVSGTIALMLSANDRLGWRDVRQILALSADHNDPSHPWWRTNASGLWINEQYGFGRINAGKAVALATNWLAPMTAEQAATAGRSVNRPIPDGNSMGVADSVALSDALRIETVTVTVNIPDHTYWGDLSIYLTSPAGTRVRLAREHFIDEGALGLGYRHWVLSDTLHFGENSQGTWTIEVIDNFSGDTGTFGTWQLTVYGVRLPDRVDQLPAACTAVALSSSGAAQPGGMAMGVSRHGGLFSTEATGPDLEDYRLMAGVKGGLPVAEQLAVAHYQAGDGVSGWFMLTGDGWTWWDGRLETLRGFRNAAGSVATLFAGRLAAGDYQVWSGYRLAGGETYACLEPLRLKLGD